ncbi:hypothetical protein Saratov15_00122 [Vibrio phage Saratov-15]|nr:hypothetical protein Saratov15_00122 [Vibrio phage Saratov-15]WJJ54305.1 hypothetical protein [Vibrio phage JPW]
MPLKFKVGDTVKVVDKGAIYTSHSMYGARYPAWVNGATPRRLTKYEIIGVHQDATTGIGVDNIYAVQNASGQVYLYGERGLELDTPTVSAPVSAIAPTPVPFVPESWMRIDGYESESMLGRVIDARKIGNSNNPACWLVGDDHRDGLQWTGNQAFRKLDPLDAAAMLLKLSDIKSGV